MSLHLQSSAYYFNFPSWVFDKVTDEYDPPCYWMRLRISAKGQLHEGCLGHLTRLWYGSGRRVRGFDPLVMHWVNEPPPVQDGSGSITQSHYQVNIPAGSYELAGLFHIKLPSRRPPESPVAEGNIPADQLPEVRINRSLNESKTTSKLTALRYGVYFFEAEVSDKNGSSTKKIFKIWAFPDENKCKIRSSRFYERWWLGLKSILRAV